MKSKLKALFVLLVPFLSLLISFVAVAAEETAGSHEAQAEGMPFSVVYQAANLLIYLAILFYFLRHPVKNYFRKKEENFREALVKADRAKHDAEVKKREVLNRLATLEETSEQSLREAKLEAEALKNKIIAEAHDLSLKMKEDARRTADFEIQRAKNELREELLTQSVAVAQKILNDKIVETDQQRLQTEFVDKIQVVR